MRILGHRKALQAVKILELFINLLYQNHICENRRMSILMMELFLLVFLIPNHASCLDFRFPDFCSYLRQIISPVPCRHHHYTNATLLSNVPRAPRFRVRSKIIVLAFLFHFPDLFLGAFVAGVPVCLLLTHSPSNVKKDVPNLLSSSGSSRTSSLTGQVYKTSREDPEIGRKGSIDL